MLKQLTLLALLSLARCAGADALNISIVGTWSSKSNTVFTGPGFYDPVDELLIEPALPGMAYSFTDDGHFEEATYRITANPKNHSCPIAVITYQHGSYEVLDNSTIILTPIVVDGRQLVSDPCNDGGISTYARYNQTVTFLKHELLVDAYHGRYRLSLNEWDGAVVQPLYLAYSPPLMLPTETLNPTASSDAAATGAARMVKRIRRSLENRGRTNAVRVSRVDFDFWWWVSVGVVGVGSVGYFFM